MRKKLLLSFCIIFLLSIFSVSFGQTKTEIKNLINQYKQGNQLSDEQLKLISPYLETEKVVLHPFSPNNTEADIFSEDFSSGALPTGWQNVDNIGDGLVWEFNNPGGRTFNSSTSGNGFAIFDSDNYGGGPSGAEDADLITPAIDCSGNTNVTLEFQHYFVAGFGGAAEVFVSGDNGSNWTSLESWGATSTANAETESYDITAIAAGQSQVKIKWNWQGDYSWYWCVDDVRLYEPSSPPNCATIVSPADAATDVAITATLNWASGGGAPTGYKIYFGTDGGGTTPPTNIENGTDLGNVTTYDPTPDLSYSTTYYWQIVPYNANGDATGCTIWSFTTMADPTVTPPWSEGFEGIAAAGDWPTGWSHTGDWTTGTSNGTNNRIPHGGTNYAYTNWSADDWLFTPPVSVTNGTNYDFSLWYVNDGTAGFSLLEVKYGNSPDAGSMTTAIASVSDPQNSTYQELTGTISPSATGSIYIGIHVVGSSAPWYQVIDDISVTEAGGPPNCATLVSPADAATDVEIDATLNWASGGGAPTGYKIYFGTDNPPTNIENGTDLGNVTTYDPTPDMSYSTTYYWQIIAYNANGDATGCSIWSFTTKADPTVTSFPWTEDFENGGAIPTNWTNDTGDSGEDWAFNTSMTYGATADHTSGSGYFADVDDSSPHTTPTNLLTPPLDISGLTAPALSFYYWIGRTSTDTSKLFIDVYNGTSWTDSVAYYTGNTNQWLGVTIDITTYKSTATKVRFRAVETSGFQSDICVDDVSVFDNTTPPSCTTPVSPTDGETGVAFDTNLDWNAAANATGYKIHFGTDGGGTTPPTNIENGTDLGNVTTYNPASNLAGNTTYYWQITPYNANGEATGCPIWSFTTLATPPNCATIVSPADGATDVDITTNLNWADGGGGTTGYKLFFGTDGGGTTPPTNLVNGTDLGNVTTYDPPTDLDYSTTYYWQVVAYNPNGDATGCAIWSFTTQSNPNYGGGGAGSGGYYFANSTSGASGAPSQPSFNWIDISGTGTDIIGSLDDDNFAGPFPIGFTFNYFGSDYTQFWVGSNGWIMFSDPTGISGSAQRTNVHIPTAGDPNNLVALFWDDLNPDDPDVADKHVYFGNSGGELVVSLVNYPEFGADADGWITAQIILKPSGNIKFQYLDHGTSIDLSGATVGIENAAGDAGIEYNYNGSGGPIFGSPLAVEFGTDDSSLPVELESFVVRAGDGKAILRWVTQSEIDNAGFEVYRSEEKDGTYQIVSTYTSNKNLQGAGNSNSPKTYTYIDPNLVNGTTYWYKISDVDYNGHRGYHGPVGVVPNKNGLNLVNDGNIPREFALRANYPNPFNPTTKIAFDIPALPNGNILVQVAVYNMLGQKVKTLVNENLSPGAYQVEWDGNNDLGRKVASGVYIYGIRTDKFTSFKKMVMMK